MFREYICRECFLVFEVIGGQEVEFCPDCDHLADRFDDLFIKAEKHYYEGAYMN